MKQIYRFKRLFASFVLLLISALSWAYDFEVNGIYYNKNSDGTSVVVKYKTYSDPGYSGSVVIPATVTYGAQTYDVTSIGESAFYNCSGLTSIKIPESVTSIGRQAFRGCSGLTSITIPNSVTSIDDYTFSGCSGLTSITIGNNVTNIGSNAFSSCSGLTSVTIPSSVTSIGESAFGNCSGLTSITIPNSVMRIGMGAFNGCTSLPVINNVCYADTYLVGPVDKTQSTYSIKEGTRFIGSYAFYNCSGLTSITIPNSVTSIGEDAFFNCSGLTSVTIPDGVTSIGEYAFYGCSGLETITMPNNLICIGDAAFFDCSSLSSITIPESVTSIGESAFYGCTGLTSISVDANNLVYNSRENCNAIIKYNELIVACNNTIIPNGVTSIGDYAFAKCTEITSINIPKSVYRIGNFAFENCSGLTSIIIGSGVTYIGYDAFFSCSGLESVSCLAENVPTTGSSAFYNVPQSTATLYVPKTSLDAYKTANQWKEFGQILPIEDGPTIIDFADANVKQLCVANWDTNGDGELDEDEAAAVTSLGEVFKNNTTITSFDELQYFTGLTTIGYQAFSSCSGLASIVIPEGVASIGRYAFRGCSDLTSINIPNSVTSIGMDAFYNCFSLTKAEFASIKRVCYISFEDHYANPLYYAHHLYIEGQEVNDLVIPNSVTSIRQCSFSGCSGLSSVTIPENVTSIGVGAFYGCTGLTMAEFASIESLCNISFGNEAANPLYYTHHLYIDGQEVTNLVIPEGVTSIGWYAFNGCSGLTSVAIPNSVTTIGSLAFYGCSGLTKSEFASIESLCNISFHDGYANPLLNAHHFFIDGQEVNDLMIPNSVTSIGEWAFSGCSDLTSITIPNSVTSIEPSAFYGCSSLTSVACLAEEVPSTGNNVFYNVPQSTATLYVPAGSVDAYKAAAQWKEFGQILPIEDGPTIIDFADANVKQLCVANWDTNGDGELDEDEAAAVTDLGSVFNNNKAITSFDELQYFTGLTSIGNSAFENCSGLTSITIPNSVTRIGEDAFFNCSGLTSITIPNSVTSIGRYAFFNCSGLTSVTIPNSVTSIGNSAFEKCSGLTSVTIPNSVTSIGRSAFDGCSGLTSISVDVNNSVYDSRNNCNAIIKTATNTLVSGCKNTTIPVSVTSIGSFAFNGCSGLTSITIPESVTSIGDDAFANCSGLTSVTIPNSVTSIGEWAFFRSGLTSVTIGNGVTSIGDYAFEYCSALTSVTIGNSVTSIGAFAFANCSGLTSINIPDGVTSIGDNTFSGCSALTSINIPDGVTSIGDWAFSGCSGLTSVTIGNSVKSIGDWAFGSCSGLTSINIPNSVTSIGGGAFFRCSGLTSVICLAEKVPATGSSVFYDVPQSTAILYVPETSLNAYKTADQWKEFGNIIGIDPTAVEELKSNKNLKANESAPIFDLMGRRLQQKPTSGYYIQGGKKFFVK